MTAKTLHMLSMSMKWQRISAVSSSQWLPCEMHWMPPQLFRSVVLEFKVCIITFVFNVWAFILHFMRLWWTSNFSHGNHFDEATTDVRCRLVYIVTGWRAFTSTNVDLSLLPWSNYSYSINLYMCWLVYRIKSTLMEAKTFRIVLISTRWQRISTVT